MIGNKRLTGMGAIVSKGASIDENSLDGASGLVTKGRVFPLDPLIVGSPAKVVRELTADEIEGLRASDVRYQNNARRYAIGLKPIGEA